MDSCFVCVHEPVCVERVHTTKVSRSLHMLKKLARGDNVLKSCRRHISLLSVAPRIKMFIGDGAKLVRDAFELAKEKCKDQSKVSCVR